MTSNLPLIRLSAINPILLELRRRGVDGASLLHSLGLPREIPASDAIERAVKPPLRPGQNDAFYMGFMGRLLKC